MSAPFGRGGHTIGKGGRTYSRGVPTYPAPPAGGAWPTRSIQGARGLTLNGGQWLAQATELWRDTLTPAERAEWKFSRIEAAWYTLEPTAGNFDWTTLDAKVTWCKSKGIRPIIDLTYCPWFWTAHPAYTGCTVSASAGRTRITTDDTDSTGFIGEINRAQWINIHVQCTGVPAGVVVAQGSNWVEVAGAPTSTGSGRTMTFGGYSGNVTEDDRHIGPDPAHYDKVARMAAAIAARYGAGSTNVDHGDAEPVMEWWNEGNGQFWKPAQRANWYGASFRYFYRAVKEVDPSIPTVMTGCSGNASTSDLGWGLDVEPFLDNLLGFMRADTTWPSWVTDTAGTFTGDSVAANNLAGQLARGDISDTFWTDMVGWHAYGFGRNWDGSLPIPAAGTDNIQTWLGTAATGTAAKFVRILNIVHAHAVAATGDTGLDDIMVMSTESGTPYHQLATTGRGAEEGPLGRTYAPPGNANRSTMSPEESYKFLTIIVQLLAGVRTWPTGGSIPARLFAGEPAKRWSIVNCQRLATIIGTYSGASAFEDQGLFTRPDETCPGPPTVGPGTLKRALASQRPRPNINSGLWDNAHIGDGADWVDAWFRHWTPA